MRLGFRLRNAFLEFRWGAPEAGCGGRGEFEGEELGGVLSVVVRGVRACRGGKGRRGGKQERETGRGEGG